MKTYIQIGAGAGDKDSRAKFRDGFTEFVKNMNPNEIESIILVEPNPINIPYLTECWKDYPQAKIYNIGICPKSYEKTIVFYYAVEDGPHYQVFSMNKEHVLKHYPNGTIKNVIVNCWELNDFINSLQLKSEIEIIGLDIEGIDFEILLDTDWSKINCNHISFEYIHMEPKLHIVDKYLRSFGFKPNGKGLDVNGFDLLYSK